MIDADELALLEQTVGEITAGADGPDLTTALDGFGWLEILHDEPRTAVRSVFASQGRAGSWSAALHDVLAADLGRFDGELAGSTTVVLPAPRAATAGRGGSINGVVVGARATDRWLVAAVMDGSLSIRRFAASELAVTPAAGLDPRLGAARVTGTAAEGLVLASGLEALEWWRTVETSGRQALGHHLCGAATRMLALALDHARERAQFGRRIGTFQAIRHKLAEAHVAVAAATAAVDATWDSDEPWLAAATAKLVVSRSAMTVIGHSQQVLAGIGFTAEHPFHRFMKRAVVLDRLLGNGPELAPIVGRELVRCGTAPRLVEL